MCVYVWVECTSVCVQVHPPVHAHVESRGVGVFYRFSLEFLRQALLLSLNLQRRLVWMTGEAPASVHLHPGCRYSHVVVTG